MKESKKALCSVLFVLFSAISTAINAEPCQGRKIEHCADIDLLPCANFFTYDKKTKEFRQCLPNTGLNAGFIRCRQSLDSCEMPEKSTPDKK